MSIHKVYLLLGANIGDRKNTLIKVKSLVNQEVGKIIKESEIIETEAVGFETDHLFLNQVLVIETEFSPMNTLKKTQEIEKRLGRTEKSKKDFYQDRVIDIDILMYDKLHYKAQKLDIPHNKNLNERGFVKQLFAKLL